MVICIIYVKNTGCQWGSCRRGLLPIEVVGLSRRNIFIRAEKNADLVQKFLLRPTQASS